MFKENDLEKSRRIEDPSAFWDLQRNPVFLFWYKKEGYEIAISNRHCIGKIDDYFWNDWRLYVNSCKLFQIGYVHGHGWVSPVGKSNWREFPNTRNTASPLWQFHYIFPAFFLFSSPLQILLACSYSNTFTGNVFDVKQRIATWALAITLVDANTPTRQHGRHRKYCTREYWSSVQAAGNTTMI